MPFTVSELENIANAAIDFHFKRQNVLSQTIQDKPLLMKMRQKSKPFPGGKEYITRRVKGVYTTTIQGYEHDDTVTYANPANIRESKYPWKLIHSGIQVTGHELTKDGISVVDSTTGKSTTQHTDREATALANLLDDKLEDMQEGTDRGMNDMYWRDGTQDSKVIPGILSFILDDPTSATVVGGIDQSINTWWRNRASVALSGVSTLDNQVVLTKLQSEFRQLRRYGGRPDTILAGSDMMEQIEKELRHKGNYTETGWANKGQIDGSLADIAFKGIMIQYDPTLDDLSREKYAYVLDCRHIYPMHIDGEEAKKHAPARPHNKYVFYRAMTHAGGLVCDQRNCHGVYAFT